VKCGIVGLDLSTRGTAAVYLPPDWTPGDWNVPEMFVGYEGGDHEKDVARLHDIAVAVERFVQKVWNEQHAGETRVFVEDYAYGEKHRGMTIGELGGAVKSRLYGSLSLVAVPVHQRTLRNLFLHGGPPVPKGKGGMALAIAAGWKNLGGRPWKDSDRCDALLVASYGRTEFGMPGLLAYG
jgi:hypothetical protein